MYNLDIATLLQLLQEFRQSGSVYAELPVGTFSSKERYQARIELMEGNVASCWIEDSNGQYRVSGGNALQTLQRLGTLDWKLQTATPQTSQRVAETSPSLPPNPSNLIPRRLAFIEQATLNRMSRKQRRVFALIDGERSVAKIADILFPASSNMINDVMEVLRDLEAMRLITIV